MKNKKRIISFLTIAAILFFAGIFLNTSAVAASTPSYSYTPMEAIPGYGKPTDFPGYVSALYKFGLWTIGISAMLMIVIGGYMYLTSAGNASQTGKAKGVIMDALAGLFLALLAWLLLYTINPDLVNLPGAPAASQSPGTPGAGGVPGTPTGPGGTTKGYAAACPDSSSTTAIDYSKAAQDANIKPNSACNNYNFTNSNGTDPKILKAMAQMESSCGTNKGPSSANACGLMQMKPETASSLAGRTVTCDDLKNDDSLSIDLASKYISQNASSSCVNGSTAAIFAGYNSGYGCSATSSACTPKKHALCDSSDCSGAKAFECCKNPSGLDESINYAWNGVGLMSK